MVHGVSSAHMFPKKLRVDCILSTSIVSGNMDPSAISKKQTSQNKVEECIWASTLLLESTGKGGKQTEAGFASGHSFLFPLTDNRYLERVNRTGVHQNRVLLRIIVVQAK